MRTEDKATKVVVSGVFLKSSVPSKVALAAELLKSLFL